MKIYEEKNAPNARRVRMFLAEKGLLDQVTFEHVDLKAGDNISADFRSKNPIAKIPVMEMEDGSYLSESVAICRYFEAKYPGTPLMGVTPEQQAVIEMWQRRCEIYFMNMVGMGFQHTSGYFSDRMKPISEWGEVCVKSVPKFFSLLDKHLAHSEFIAGNDFSIADITAFVTMDFAKIIRTKPDEGLVNLKRWYDQINTRGSVKA
jgi:glutathione S-transferase